MAQGARSAAIQPWTRPILRWAGSKRQMLPVLSESMPKSYGRYIEVMAGSACLFFAERPKTAVLADFNGDLIATYECIRAHPRLVARAAWSWAPDGSDYYLVRDLDPASLTQVQRAARFIYLNRFSFNGVYRTNMKGKFNVPRGRDTGRLPEESHVYRCSVALRSATLLAMDFQEVTALAVAGDFVYLDPPYSTRRPRQGEYGYGSFDESDEARLFEVLEDLDQRGVWFLLSYGGSPPIGLPQHWSSSSHTAVRTVGGKVERRHSTSEYLLANYGLTKATR